jgi:hypothetical protein
LTPSGDDLVIGLLLSLNRCRDAVWPREDRHKLNRQVVAAAYRNTTTLSANLIECAALGQADERLINAVDSIAYGVVRGPQVVDDLLGWGNSSGVDALAGMAIVLSA